MTSADVLIAVSPFSHSMGLSALLVHGLSHGVPLVTMPRFDLSGFLGALQSHRVTAALVAPPVVRTLAEHPAVDAFDLSSLRWVWGSRTRSWFLTSGFRLLVRTR